MAALNPALAFISGAKAASDLDAVDVDAKAIATGAGSKVGLVVLQFLFMARS